MREMKDSGVAWVGNMPEGWNVKRGKFTLKLLSRPVVESDEVITCFRDGEVTLRKNRREDGFTVSLKEIGYQGLEPGDLVIHGMDGFAGSIGISDSRGKSSPVLVVCDSNENKKYIMYYLRSMAYNDVFTALATGIRVRSCDLRWNKLAELPYILPCLDEQEEIVRAIDVATTKIDALISNNKAQIEKLKQYKQSLISEVVTKGLDPTVPMKDSGVEWVKEIPTCWEMLYQKTLFKQSKEKARPDDIQLTSSQQLGIVEQEKYMELTGSRVVVVEKDFDILKHVDSGDFVISMRSFQGGIEYSNVSGCISSAYVMLKPNLKRIYPRYYRWLLKSSLYINSIRSTSNLVRDGQAMRYANFIQIWLPCPPIAQQETIADYLDKKCPQIDRLIAIKQAKIEKLNQYKKSLIYEYVTGKKEVRIYGQKRKTL